MKGKKKKLIAILSHYYDLPNMINDELREVRRYTRQTEPVVVSVRENYQKHANALIAAKDKIKGALEQLDRVDRKIIQLKYMGPQEPQERKQWSGRSPAWKEIASGIEYCDAGWVSQKASIAMNKLCKILFDSPHTS